jgi:hypothetical protein
LLASQVDHSLIRKLKLYTEPPFLLIDELGYLSLGQQTSNLFYQVISTRHSHREVRSLRDQHSLFRLGEYHPARAGAFGPSRHNALMASKRVNLNFCDSYHLDRTACL